MKGIAHVRYLPLTIALAALAGSISFGVSYWMNDDAVLGRVAQEGDAMAWLRKEFHLTDRQFAAIKQLHQDYGVICATHCTAINAAKRRGAPPAEIANLEGTCVRSMMGHFQQVAALMSSGEGERYLAMVLPRVAAYDHVSSPDLQGKP
jgi:hypothetical protein